MADGLVETLRRLSEAVGVPGFEEEPRQLIRQEIEGLVDRVWVDPLGNLLALRRGESKHPRILLDAHTDEVGFLVRHVDERGFLRLSPLGGWDPRILPGQRVVLQPRDKDGRLRRVYGVVVAVPPHLTTREQREKVIPLEELAVDIGVDSQREAEELGVGVGTPLTVWQPFLELAGGSVTGKAFDDRVGCTVLIHVLRRLAQSKEQRATVVANFAVSEEVGLRGARTGAYTLEPDVALALECTTAADVPGVPEHKNPTSLGRGPAITVADRSLIAHPRVVETLHRVALEQKIPYQVKKPLTGGTDAGSIALTRGGVPAGVVSVPCRNIHSAVSLLRLSDLQSTIDLVYGFVEAWPSEAAKIREESD